MAQAAMAMDTTGMPQMPLAATCIPGVSCPVNQEAPPDMNGDSALAGKILRKRREEMARRSVLLNPRSRVFGADQTALASQVEEKQIVAAAAAEAEAEDAKVTLMQGQVLQTIEEAKRSFAREQQVSTVEYSLKNLNKESRREYDLSDPNRLKKDIVPANGIGSDGRQMGLCSMQIWEGDQDPKEVKKLRANAQAEWLAMQVQEKQHREQMEREAERMEAQEVLNTTKLREAIESVEAQEAHEERLEMRDANLQLAAETKARKENKKNKETMLNTRIFNSTREDERLAEVHDYKINSMGRLCRDEYKRLTYEEEQAILDSNAQMILEKKAMARLEEQATHEADSELNGACALMDQLGSLAEEQKKERLRKQVARNQEYAEQKKLRDAEEKEQRLLWLPKGEGPRTGHGGF